MYTNIWCVVKQDNFEYESKDFFTFKEIESFQSFDLPISLSELYV